MKRERWSRKCIAVSVGEGDALYVYVGGKITILIIMCKHLLIGVTVMNSARSTCGCSVHASKLIMLLHFSFPRILLYAFELPHTPSTYLMSCAVFGFKKDF